MRMPGMTQIPTLVRVAVINYLRSVVEMKPHMVKAIELYEIGHITQTEFVNFVPQITTLEEIEEFIKACPPDLMVSLKEFVASYNKSHITFHMGSYVPGVTSEQIKESQRKEKEQMEKGIQLLKKHLL